MFPDNIKWHNDSVKQAAESQCGDDHECLFDVASTNDLSVGLATKDISSQLVNESKALGKVPKDGVDRYLFIYSFIRSHYVFASIFNEFCR